MEEQIFLYSAFVYNFCLVLTLYFAHLYEKSHGINKIIYLYISFIIIFLFCSLRFYVGNDYGGYVRIFEDAKFGRLSYIEPGFYFLNKFFTFSKIGYLYVITASSFMTLLFLFKVMIRNNILFYGIFFMFTTELLIMTNDQIRQGIAISIFLYAIRFIEEEKPFKYFLSIVFASTMFHFSAIILLPLYFISKIRINRIIWILIILTTLVLSFKGAFNNILDYILDIFPKYQKYKKIALQLQISEMGSGLGILYHVVILLPVAIFQKKINRPVITNLVLLGLIVFLISKDFLITKRVTFYLLFVNFIALSLFLKMIVTKYTVRYMLNIMILVTCFLYFQIQNLYAKEQFGAIPYRSFLFETNLDQPKSKEYYHE